MDNYIKLLQEHRVSHLVCATDQVRYYLALRTHAAVLLSDYKLVTNGGLVAAVQDGGVDPGGRGGVRAELL